jgi:hypothetical protein
MNICVMMRGRHDVGWYHAVAVFLGVSIPSRENEGCISCKGRRGDTRWMTDILPVGEGGLINAGCRVTEKVAWHRVSSEGISVSGGVEPYWGCQLTLFIRNTYIYRYQVGYFPDRR